MRLTIGAIVVASLVSAVAVAKPREMITLSPSGKWIVNYADDACRLGREFGEGDQKVILIMDQFSPGDWFRLSIAGNVIQPRSSIPPYAVKLRYGPTEAEAETSGMPGKIEPYPAFFVHGHQRLAPLTAEESAQLKDILGGRDEGSLPPIGEAREKSVTWLSLSELMRRDLTLQTGPMDKPLAALRSCSWDLVKSWGLNVEQQKKLTRKPRAKNPESSWFKPNEYPKEMLRGGHQAIVHFRVMVDAEGDVSSCHIQASTRPKEFDDLVCASVKRRAKFEPALDEHGRPITSFWRNTVIYRIAY